MAKSGHTGPTGPEVDQPTGQETTGHEWDGIKELNTPLPRWWLWTFYATVIWAVGYMIFYPAIPLINEATSGLLGYSSRAELLEEVAEARSEQAVFTDRIDRLELADIRADADLFAFAVAGGRSAYSVNCSQCHGAGAQGFPGYPNLNDDEWLWGGTLEDIRFTLENGIRHDPDPETRFSLMPAFGRDGLLDETQIADVTEHVLALAGKEHDAAMAERGVEIYAQECAICHGPGGEGDPFQGAPALNDAIWLYAGERASIRQQLHTPRHGVMPAWGDRLDGATIKKLAVYVHALGGGQ